MNTPNNGLAPTQNEQIMTSLEIAEVTNKNHKEVMRSIRKMEKSWEKVCGRKFALTSQTIAMPNGGHKEVPFYSLTKTEALFISTAFSHEMRAKLVIRWEYLEKNKLEDNTILLLDRRILELRSEQMRLGGKLSTNKARLKSLKVLRQKVDSKQLTLEL